MTVYDEFGNEVQEVNVRATGGKVYNLDSLQDRGREPNFTKESLLETVLTVHGIVGPESFPLGPVYFILLKRSVDLDIDDPWGVMFPANSPVVTLTLRAARQKMLPFQGILERVTSESNPDRQYWQWARKR